ncbi:hypothetical protein [Maribacter sp. 2307UL18-2]|uniref:hypothetical protein n=1 Tax=Maribacter sp. 2307UL18-2 TaxID=3386274 RepID=UPI0039BC6834
MSNNHIELISICLSMNDTVKKWSFFRSSEIEFSWRSSKYREVLAANGLFGLD